MPKSVIDAADPQTGIVKEYIGTGPYKLDDIMLAAYSKPEFYELYSSYMFKEQADWYSEEGSEYFNQNNPERAKELLAEAGYNGELLTYDWSTFVGIRNNEPENYSAFITSFAPKIIPTMNLYLSSSWAGWCEDEKIVEGLSSINTDSSKESAVKTWNELQKYMNETSVPVVKLGSKYNFMVCKAGFDGLEFFERPLVVNARLYE